MNREDLIERIKQKAKRDARHRADRRFKETMGFLVAKGFLQANYPVMPKPSQRLRVEDAIWAGKNVEPRILEVLPAAVLRLGKHFDMDPKRHKDLAVVVEQLRQRKEHGDEFCGMPYEKVRVWADVQLPDKRVKPISERKVVKTYRLNPTAIEWLKARAQAHGCTETELLESYIFSFRPEQRFESYSSLGAGVTDFAMGRHGP